MNVYEFFRRFMTASVIIVLAALAGCKVSIDKTRTTMLVTHSVSPGVEGMSTTQTRRCDFKSGPISQEKADVYLKDPAQAVIDGECVLDIKKDVMQGAPTVAGQVTVGATNALSNGLFSYVIQNRLQRQQQEFCLRTNSCGSKTEIHNLNQTSSAAAAQQSMDNKMTVGPLACQEKGDCGQ